MPQPTFEEAYTDLMDTVARLEQGGLTLDKSLDGFEHGMALYRLCDHLLDQVEQRVTRLVEESSLEEE